MRQRISSAALLAAFVLSACSGGTSLPTAGKQTAGPVKHVRPHSVPPPYCSPPIGTTIGQFTEYPLPWSGSNPAGLAVDETGTAWVAAYGNGYIAKFVPSTNTWTRYATYSGSSEPFEVAIGPDANPWFTEYLGNRIGVIRSGALTEYALSAPYGITSGNDGNLYVGNYSTGASGGIYKVTTTGSATKTSTAGGVFDVYADTSDTIWGVQYWPTYNRIVKDVNGTISYTAIPSASSKSYSIVQGPTGTGEWFVEYATNKLANLTTSGSIVEHAIPTANSEPLGVVSACGKLWFGESATNKIGSFDPTTSKFTEYTVPTTNSQPNRLAVDANGNVWFSEYGANKIAMITTASGPAPNGTMYVSNNNGVTVYGAGVTAPPPTATITSVPSGWPSYSAIDWSGNLWVAEGANGVAEYAGNASGNATPITSIQTPIYAYGVAVDQAGEIFVSDPNTSTIDVFAAGSSGAATPIRQIAGSNTGLNGSGLNKIVFDANDNLWVTNVSTNSVLEFPANANGNVAPALTLDSTWAANNGIRALDVIALKSDGTLAVLANDGENVMVFAPGVSEGSTYENAFSTQSLHDISVDTNGFLYGSASTSSADVYIYPLASTGTPSPYATISGSNDGISQAFGITVANGVSGSARHASFAKKRSHPH